MDQLLKNAFNQQITSKTGIDFEDFIDELYLLKYGVDDYIPIRRNKDKGNDGTILPEKKILACYAPRKYNKTDFEIKVLGNSGKIGDFQKYEKDWSNKYPNWEMLVNHEISPDQLKLIQNLSGNTSIKGITHILSIIENDLTSQKRRKLAQYLEIDDFIKQDYVLDIINDLLNSSNLHDKTVQYKLVPYIPEKIKINFDQDDVDGALSEFYFIAQDFSLIDNILSGYEGEEINTVKWRVIDDYNKLSGTFKIRLDNLTTQYANQYGNDKDDEYRKFAKTILLYMFEQCLIGKKTNKEK